MKSGKRPPDCSDAFTRIEQTLLAGALLDGENGEGGRNGTSASTRTKRVKEATEQSDHQQQDKSGQIAVYFCQCDPASSVDAVQPRVKIPSEPGTCGMPIFAYLCDIDLTLVHDRNI